MTHHTPMQEAMTSLEQVFGHEYKPFDRESHAEELSQRNTRLGEYWEWVIHQIEGSMQSVDHVLRVGRLAKTHGWLPTEIVHAVSSGSDLHYGVESIIQTVGGRSIRFPAYPEECNYVRIVQDGIELAYWNSDEWQDDPHIMGALMGAAHGPAQDSRLQPAELESGNEDEDASWNSDEWQDDPHVIEVPQAPKG